MLKIRLQGTTNDIKWFKKILERDKRITVLDISETSRRQPSAADAYGCRKRIYRSPMGNIESVPKERVLCKKGGTGDSM